MPDEGIFETSHTKHKEGKWSEPKLKDRAFDNSGNEREQSTAWQIESLIV